MAASGQNTAASSSSILMKTTKTMTYEPKGKFESLEQLKRECSFQRLLFWMIDNNILLSDDERQEARDWLRDRDILIRFLAKLKAFRQRGEKPSPEAIAEVEIVANRVNVSQITKPFDWSKNHILEVINLRSPKKKQALKPLPPKVPQKDCCDAIPESVSSSLRAAVVVAEQDQNEFASPEKTTNKELTEAECSRKSQESTPPMSPRQGKQAQTKASPLKKRPPTTILEEDEDSHICQSPHPVRVDKSTAAADDMILSKEPTVIPKCNKEKQVTFALPSTGDCVRAMSSGMNSYTKPNMAAKIEKEEDIPVVSPSTSDKAQATPGGMHLLKQPNITTKGKEKAQSSVVSPSTSGYARAMPRGMDSLKKPDIPPKDDKEQTPVSPSSISDHARAILSGMNSQRKPNTPAKDDKEQIAVTSPTMDDDIRTMPREVISEKAAEIVRRYMERPRPSLDEVICGMSCPVLFCSVNPLS